MHADGLPDRRLNAYRPDLADIRLKGLVDAERYVEGEARAVVLPVVGLRPRPDLGCGIDTELLIGEPVRVFEVAAGWAFVQAGLDGYAGYVPEAAVGPALPEPTHIVTAPRTFVYPEAELRRPCSAALSMGSRIRVTGQAETRGTAYLLLDSGEAVIAAHCVPLGTFPETDPVTIAARLVETPYLWGGRSAFGIDCSGLVQLSHQMTGRRPPRDSDMQRDGYGEPVPVDGLQRGDLVFWKGHVGMMEDATTLLHASGHTMTVTREDFAAAVARIGYLYGPPTLCRRPA